MSYDVYLQIDAGGVVPADLGVDWNYTSNCAQMWRAAGADIAAFHGKLAGECANILADALTAMRADPAHFIAMNPPNKWGSYASLLPALEVLLAKFRAHPKATVRVSR